ncbi:hypothetical protein [Flectobacillus major]|uniref:hypothetical protein n=1 Tax=Flectobacillus major TaxID=103 RepID=UPI0005C5B056|nr:hypothetical protein [Flectobacillus major]
MNTIRHNTITKKLLVYSLILFSTIAFSACSKKITFLTSAVVPAARGDIKVTRDGNKNYVIHINIDDLAEVSRLTPPKQTYVVWMVTDQNYTKNLGQVNSNSKMLSSQLKASFETVSSFKPIKIFITAEDNASIQYPGNVIVLSTDNF